MGSTAWSKRVRARVTPHRGQVESLVPLYTRRSVSLPFSQGGEGEAGQRATYSGQADVAGGSEDGSGRGGVGRRHGCKVARVQAGARCQSGAGAYTRPLFSST